MISSYETCMYSTFTRLFSLKFDMNLLIVHKRTEMFSIAASMSLKFSVLEVFLAFLTGIIVDILRYTENNLGRKR